jgi:hypothetical protein
MNWDLGKVSRIVMCAGLQSLFGLPLAAAKFVEFA